MTSSEDFELSLELAPDPLSVSVARAVVRSLASVVPATLVDDAEVVLSELVTNAIRHGSPVPGARVAVELTVGDGFLAGHVSDHGPSFDDAARRPEEGQVGGFGLHIVRSLSELAYSRTARGNRATFRVTAAAPGPLLSPRGRGSAALPNAAGA